MQTPLYSLTRGDYEEVVIPGEIVVSDGRDILFESSEAIGHYPARSLLKPFQFFATEILQNKKTDGITGKLRYVAALGSISATEDQVVQLKSWYSKPEFQSRFSFLQLPPCYPYDETHRVHLKDKGLPPEWYYHACFSKHMAILEACEKQGWEREIYNSPDHPFHKKLMEKLEEVLEESLAQVRSVKDGCTLPTPVLSLKQLAKLYCKLTNPQDSQGPLAEISNLMMEKPFWIGGCDREDTKLMELNPGKLIAKEGADGLLAIGCKPTDRFPEGLGMVVKIMPGYLPQQMVLAIAPLLENLGFEVERSSIRGQGIHYHYKAFEKNVQKIFDISPSVDVGTAVFPGDCSYRREKSLDTEKGDHLTLSKIETTVHIGAHADAPNHFSKDHRGIDSVMLSKYLGPCQVIEIRKGKGGLIQKEDLPADIDMKRILIKTRSCPSITHFNEDFVAFSPEAIEYLGSKGVTLVGIDTPSLDPCQSKTLDAHQMTLKYDMAILEGIVLANIPGGQYELTALPLSLKGADASPVRAILTPL